MRMWWSIVVGVVATVSLVTLGVSGRSSAEPFPVNGTFILWDEFSADAGELCDAKRSFYHDINRDTTVTLAIEGGEVLSESTLGDGRIVTAAELASVLTEGGAAFTEAEASALLDQLRLEPCVFRFGFEVTPGSDRGEGYRLTLGRRGSWVLEEQEIRKPGQIQWSVGLRPTT